MNPPRYTDCEYVNFLIGTQLSYSCVEAAKVQPLIRSSPEHDAINRLLYSNGLKSGVSTAPKPRDWTIATSPYYSIRATLRSIQSREFSRWSKLQISNRLSIYRIPPDSEALWQEAGAHVKLDRGLLLVDDSTLDKPSARANAHEKIRPFLTEFPSPVNRTGASIAFCEKNNRRYMDGSVAYCSQIKGRIYYSAWHEKPNSPCLYPITDEPYEEGLRIVQENAAKNPQSLIVQRKKGIFRFLRNLIN